MNGLTSTALGRLGTSGLPRDWLPTLLEFLDREPVVVRIVVAEVRGSTPREPGAFMLVGRDSVAGSIGGGQLEWEAVASARDLLADTGRRRAGKQGCAGCRRRPVLRRCRVSVVGAVYSRETWTCFAWRATPVLAGVRC